MALTDKLKNIGNAIREKTGKTDLIPLDNMPDEIRSISGGGGDTNPTAQPKEVNFYDYEGTLRYSYTLAEAKALESLPPGPMHEGLTFQEWNWSLDDIKALEYPMNVGATYITDDGKTRLYISIPANAMANQPPPRNQLPLYIQQTVDNGVTIDWGDGSPTETIAGTGAVNTTHTYEKAGDFVITLDPVDGCELAFGNGSNYGIIKNAINETSPYNSIIEIVEIGKNVMALGPYAFANCNMLRYITIPNTVIALKGYYFNKCTSLEYITIQKGVNESPEFQYCYSLKNISFPTSIGIIPSFTFRKCYVLFLKCIQKSIAYIGSSAFMECSALTSMAINSDNITNISVGLFMSCNNLLSLTISQSIIRIDSRIFEGCYNVKDIFFFSSEPPIIESDTFKDIASDCIFHVLPESLEAYKTATNWTVYAEQLVGDVAL